jgi:HSP20 family protein
MALVRWDPFSELNSLHDQVNSMFNQTIGNARPGGGMLPAVDVYDNDKQLTIEAHLPSFKESEISIEQHENELAIKAEHQGKEEDREKKYLVRESLSSYYRRFTLPKNSDVEGIEAHFEDGVLKLTVPYKELPQPRKITLSAKSKSDKN